MKTECPNCNKAVRKRAKFCRSCGTKLVHDDFNFENEQSDALKLDIGLITEIMQMHEEDDESYEIELVSNKIDLHVDASSLDFGTPVLQIQLELAEKAIDSSIANGYDHIEFVTGKGDFVLYDRIRKLLEDHTQIGRIDSTVARIQAFFKSSR